jgi:hypothetical protein
LRHFGEFRFDFEFDFEYEMHARMRGSHDQYRWTMDYKHDAPEMEKRVWSQRREASTD